jgi:uncharacterized protein YjiS (DUF1127 family)
MAQVIRNWHQSRRYQHIMRELRALSQQELNALGIAHDQISIIAAKAAYLCHR